MKSRKMKCCFCFQGWVWFFHLFLQIPIFKESSGDVGNDIQILDCMPSACLFLQHPVNCRNMVGLSHISLALKPCIFKKVCTRLCSWKYYSVLQFTDDALEIICVKATMEGPAWSLFNPVLFRTCRGIDAISELSPWRRAY